MIPDRLTRKELCHFLGISRMTLWRWERSGLESELGRFLLGSVKEWFRHRELGRRRPGNVT
jgi:predicted DNA-binding transcriptional regulator AlpA